MLLFLKKKHLEFEWWGCDTIYFIFKMHVQGFTATGLKKDEVFVGDINTLYKGKNTVVDVKVDTYSNVRREVLVLNLNLWFFHSPS